MELTDRCRPRELIWELFMHRECTFSVSALCSATAVVGLSLVYVQLTADDRDTERSLHEAYHRIANLETAAVQRDRREEIVFSGVHGDPILAVDPRPVDIYSQRIPPRLFRVINRRAYGEGRNWQLIERPAFGWTLGLEGRQLCDADQQVAVRHVGIGVRLLRSLNAHDYYRLIYHPCSHLESRVCTRTGTERTCLFQYDGTPRLLVDTQAMGIAIGPTAEAAVEALLDAYPDEDAARLRACWIDDSCQQSLLAQASSRQNGR